MNRSESGATRAARRGSALLFLVHLRLPFQLMLAPIFLLGAWIAAARVADWVVPFVLVHVCLYGGATAFNSYYDQDRGPIGFLKRPVPATPAVRNGGLALQVFSVAVLTAMRPAAGLIALVLAVMGIAYSHPAIRWKSSAIGGLAAVALGQGVGAVALGYLGSGGAFPLVAPLPGAAIGAGVLTAGIYPLTQVYQIEEDRGRGDATLPVLIGWRRTFTFSGVLASMGLVILAFALGDSLVAAARQVLFAAPLALCAVLIAWSRRFPRQGSEKNHDWAMGIGIVAALLFLALLFAGWNRASAAEGGPDGEGAWQPIDSSGCVVRDSSDIQVRSEGNLTHATARARFPVDPDLVWSVILDYEELPRYVPMIDSCRVLRRDTSVDVVRQTGSSHFIVDFTMSVTLEFRRISPQIVAFRMLEGDMKAFFGTWQVERTPGGSFLTYDAHLRHGLPVPGPLNRRLLRKLCENMLAGIEKEIRARGEASPPDSLGEQHVRD